MPRVAEPVAQRGDSNGRHDCRGATKLCDLIVREKVEHDRMTSVSYHGEFSGRQLTVLQTDDGGSKDRRRLPKNAPVAPAI
jgi:hypothetical protein